MTGMSTHDPGWPGRVPPEQPGGTVYGAGGAPVEPSVRHGRDRLMPVAALIGGLGVLVGVLFATGLTPFGPSDPGVPADAGAPAWRGSPTVAPTSAAPAPTTAAPTSQAPSSPPASVGVLRSVVSSLCLDVAQGGGDGAAVQQMQCTGAPTQMWRLDRAGDVLAIVNTTTGGCLDVAGASRDNHAPVQQWSCQDVPQQRWRVAPADNGFTLVSLASDKCLDVPGASRDQGVQVSQFDCNGTDAQRWIFGN